MKTFVLSSQISALALYSGVFINYTLYDGLRFKNGLLVKYYTNNNFIGRPLYISRIPNSFIAST
jgi:hypothetical protein